MSALSEAERAWAEADRKVAARERARMWRAVNAELVRAAKAEHHRRTKDELAALRARRPS